MFRRLEQLSFSCSDRTGHPKRFRPTNQDAAHQGRRYIKTGNALATLMGTAALFLTSGIVVAEDKPAAGAKPIYEFTVKDTDGKEVSLSKYKGDVVLIVNVASQCGYTDKTYSGLQALFDKYKDKGFKVVAFPANDFGGQEPGSDSEIKSFCQNEKKATFDLMAKVAAKGPQQAPIYKYLTTHPNKDVAGDLKWNFEKYLVGRDGQVIARFGTKTMPEDPKVTEAVEKALAAPKP